MTARLHVRSAGPQVTVQDLGRPGWIAYGLSRGGAMDRDAIHEGAALLRQDAGLAALEMAGQGGVFEAEGDLRIALTGARMRARIDGAPVTWNASHLLPGGARLEIGPAEAGLYGYLHVGGGIASAPMLGGRGAHMAAGLGRALTAGDTLPVGEDPGTRVGERLAPSQRLAGGEIRVAPSLQTDVFPDETRRRFEQTAFRKDSRANRHGARMDFDGDGFGVSGGLSVVSEVIVPGDIQVTGDGVPYVLMAESQTTGGYPRIGTVIAADLPRVAQAAPGTALTFRFVTLSEARAIEARHAADLAALSKTVEPLTRDPAQMPDLLSYTLVSGVTRGDDL